MDNKKYNDFLSLATERYSCREYADREVSRELIMKVLESAHIAPSACNKQPWKFVIVDKEEGKNAVCECYGREWIKTAPMFILALGNKNEAWKRGYDGKSSVDIDLSIAIQQICLAATSLGLGTCWVCNFDEPKCKESFNIGDEWEITSVIPIGYPANDNIPTKNRKDINDIIEWSEK